jgi:hypothetical protein
MSNLNVKNLSLSQQLFHSTIMIKTNHGAGTGFFFDFAITQRKGLAIVTNKHVVQDPKTLKYVDEMELTFTKVNDLGDILIDDAKTSIKVEMDKFKQHLVFHPDENVDLCLIPMIDGKNLLRIKLSENLIPTEQQINELEGIEEIIMMGYPSGIVDRINNLPIARRGITATPIRFDYMGKKEFLIDCACFPGSSGSPIFIYNSGKVSNFMRGPDRVYFVGILYSGPQHFIEGKVIFAPIQHDFPKAIANIPNNLGCVIKSQKLLDFKPILQKLFAPDI